MTLILDRRGTRTEGKTKILDKVEKDSIHNTHAVGLLFHERKGLHSKKKQNGRYKHRQDYRFRGGRIRVPQDAPVPRTSPYVCCFLISHLGSIHSISPFYFATFTYFCKLPFRNKVEYK